MFDIGFWELLVIGVVLLLVMGPERLPEVAKQAAFFIRKIRQGVFRLRSEMQDEMDGTPFAGIEEAKREMNDFKNDIKQFGRDLAGSADQSSQTKPVEYELMGSKPLPETVTSESDEVKQKAEFTEDSGSKLDEK